MLLDLDESRSTLQVTPNLYGNLITNIAAGKPVFYSHMQQTLTRRSNSIVG
jgi:hypothetical protein